MQQIFIFCEKIVFTWLPFGYKERRFYVKHIVCWKNDIAEKDTFLKTSI